MSLPHVLCAQLLRSQFRQPPARDTFSHHYLYPVGGQRWHRTGVPGDYSYTVLATNLSD